MIDAAAALLSGETTGKKLAAWNTKALHRCNSSAVAKRKDTGTKLELVNCLIVDFKRTL